MSNEIAVQVAKLMNECGATNIIKAKYTKEISQIISQTNRNIFCQLRPHIVNRKERAWIETYKLLNKWLSKEKRTITLETMKIEMNSKNVEFPNDDPLVSFKKLIAITRVRPDSMEEKVEEFISQIPNIKFVEQGTEENTEIKVSSDLSKSEAKSEVTDENPQTKIENQNSHDSIDIDFSDVKEDENSKSQEEIQVNKEENNKISDDAHNNVEKPEENEEKKEEERKDENTQNQEGKSENFSDFSYESIGDTKVEPIAHNEPEHTGFTSSSNDDIFLSDSFN